MTTAAADLTLAPARQLVAGEWSSVAGTGSSTVHDVERALAAAQQAYEDDGLESLGTAARADLLESIATRLAQISPQTAAADSVQTGVPLAQTSMLAVIVSGAFALAAGQLRAGVTRATLTRDDAGVVEVRRLARGPAACVLPWNAPSPMASHKIASALAAGAPTICKPSELAGAGVQRIAEVVGASLAGAGLHPGAFQLVQGGPQVGAQVVGDRRVRSVSFTGGLVGGRAIAAACAPNLTAVQLELGGNNPLVVMPDTDVHAAARAAVDLLTTLNGQWCRALGRLIVPEELEAPILEAILAQLAVLRAGDPLADDVDLGPMVNRVHRDMLLQRIGALGEAGGVAHSATEVPAGDGSYLAPTLVTGVSRAAAREEIFGPVATVHPYRTVDEAVEIANDSPYGLEGYVHGRDEQQATAVARRIRAGEVKVNGSTVMSLHLMSPRPSCGLSGLGDEGTAETLLFFTSPRVTGVENAGALHRGGSTP